MIIKDIPQIENINKIITIILFLLKTRYFSSIQVQYLHHQSMAIIYFEHRNALWLTSDIIILQMNWMEAHAECNKQGMDLANLESQEENACVRSFITKQGSYVININMIVNFKFAL